MREHADEGSGADGTAADGPEVLRVTGAVVVPAGRAGTGAGAPAGGAGGAEAPSAALVLVSARGTTFHLPVDGTLRAVLRQATTAPAPADVALMPLRPKEIQTRIRAGESATELAESSGAPLEQIQRYAGPVLAERAHVATVARATVVRTSGSRPTLDDLVRHRLASRGVALATVEWDAWRRGETGWALQVSFRAGTRDRLAQWAYDPAGESVEPLDDEARWLSASHEADSPGAGRRLSAVRVFDVETDGGLREVPVVPAPPLFGDLSQATGPLPSVAGSASAGGGSAAGGPAPSAGPGPGSPALLEATGRGAEPDDGGGDRAGAGAVSWTVPDHDEVAARTMDLLDALSDRRGRRQPVPDLGAGGWDEDGDDDDLVDALLDDLPTGGSGVGDTGDLPVLPPFGAAPPAPVVEPWLRSVPTPEPTSEPTGEPSAPVTGTGAAADHGDRGPDADGADPEDGRRGTPEEGAGWSVPRTPVLGLVPPLALPQPEPALVGPGPGGSGAPGPAFGGEQPWTGEVTVPSRDLLSVREGRIGRGDQPADTGELGLADTGELSAAQLRELHAVDREHHPAGGRPGHGAAHDDPEDDSHDGADGGTGRGPEPSGSPDEEPPAAARPRSSRRSSVPSWDEIVFGSPRTDGD